MMEERLLTAKQERSEFLHFSWNAPDVIILSIRRSKQGNIRSAADMIY